MLGVRALLNSTINHLLLPLKLFLLGIYYVGAPIFAPWCEPCSHPIRERKQPVKIYFVASTSWEAAAGLFSSTNNSKGHVVTWRWFVEPSGSFWPSPACDLSRNCGLWSVDGKQLTSAWNDGGTVKTLEFTLNSPLANRVLFMEKLAQKNIQVQWNGDCHVWKSENAAVEHSNCCRNNSGNVSDISRKGRFAFISTFDEDGEMQRFPRAVGRVCCRILRLSGKVCSFFPVADCADKVNTLCGSLVWSFILNTHCHHVVIKSHFFLFAA